MKALRVLLWILMGFCLLFQLSAYLVLGDTLRLATDNAERAGMYIGAHLGFLFAFLCYRGIRGIGRRLGRRAAARQADELLS